MAERYELDPGEQIVRRINRSIMDLVPVLFSSGLIILMTIAGLVGYIAYHSELALVPPLFVVAVALLLIMVATAVALTGTYVYRHNYLLITNIHIIKIEQVGLFNDRTAQLELSHVQDINGSRHGFLETVLNYGDIEIETAAAQENFLFRNVAAPQTVADELAQLHARYISAAPEAAPPPAPPVQPQGPAVGQPPAF